MTKNRNWQSRVEIADQLRQETKHRKQRADDKRQWRAWVQQLLVRQLDRHSEVLNGKTLHLWTDCSYGGGSGTHLGAADRVDDSSSVSHFSTFSMVSPSTTSNRRRNYRSRSVSIGSEGESLAYGKGRARSNSSTEVPSSPAGRNKGRARSNSTTQIVSSPRGDGGRKRVAFAAGCDSEEQNPSPHAAGMCKTHFFRGKCAELSSRGRRKSGGCRLVHFDDDNVSLHDMVSSTGCDDELKRSEEALSGHVASRRLLSLFDDLHPGAMHAIFHVEVAVSSNTEDETISAQVSERLANQGIPLHSIVYLSLENVLIFDRYRQGTLFDRDRDLLHSVLGDEVATLYCRKQSIGEEDESTYTEDHALAVQSLPAAVLEHILIFLPDEAVAVFSRVCKSWNQEIGKTPNLWKQMLDRRDWPHPPTTQCASKISAGIFRDQFLEHYSVMRDLNAINVALQDVCDTSGKARAVQKEVAFQNFSSRSHAPTYPNECVGIKIWSPNRVLVAYDDDCTVRLFETTAKTGNTDEIQCREIVCQSFDPFSHTKRIDCCLQAMDLDQEFIGCLCSCYTVGTDGPPTYSLALCTREDYLLGRSGHAADAIRSSESDTGFYTINIRKVVLKYLVDQVGLGIIDGHPWPFLVNFLTDDGELDDVSVDVSNSLCSFGLGRFLVEVSLWTESNDRSTRIRLLAMISASTEEVVCAVSYDWNPLAEGNIAASRQSHGFGTTTCQFALSTKGCPAIMVGSIDPDGSILCCELVEESIMVRNEIVKDSWEVQSEPGERLVLVAQDDVIAADVLMKRVDITVAERKSVISFYPRCRGSRELCYETLFLEGNAEVIRMSCIRNKFLLLLCRKYYRLSHQQTGNAQDNANERGTRQTQVGGCRGSVDVVVVHIATRRVVGCVCLQKLGSASDNVYPLFAADCHGTVAVDLGCRGIAVSGSDVRALADSSKTSGQEGTQHSAKKNKNRKVKDSKDRFTRGMSLRG